jgi:hypothetical protein
VGSIGIQQLPGYAEADVRLGWNPHPGWSFSLTGKNLLHSQHAEFNAPPGRRYIARSMYAQVTWRF